MSKYAVDVEAWFIIEATSDEEAISKGMDLLNKLLSEETVGGKGGEDFDWEIVGTEKEI